MAVTIVAYNTADLIERCVRSVRELSEVAEVLVVDHGTDDSLERAESAGAVGIRDATNPGFGAGQNRAVAATSAPYILLLNPDARMDALGLARGVAYLDMHPSVAAVQGVIISERTGSAERSQGRELGWPHLAGRALGLRHLIANRVVRNLLRRTSLRDHVDRYPPEARSVETLAATAMLIRRNAFEQVHGFEPSYFLYGEDLDLCRRLRQCGWRLVALPDAWAIHRDGATSDSWTNRELQWWRGTMTFAARWWPTRQWLAARCAAATQVARLIRKDPRRTSEIVRMVVIEPGDERRRARQRVRNRLGFDLCAAHESAREPNNSTR